jgi:two-component system, cell cycle response regulator DivK
LSAGGPSRTVLLVEDSEAIRNAFTILLEDAGYTVLGTGSGRDALVLAERHAPDLVLLDMGLPDLGGLEVVRRLKAAEATRRSAVVAVTGRDEERDRTACLAAGCEDYLIKPVQLQRLLRSIPEYLARARAAT